MATGKRIEEGEREAGPDGAREKKKRRRAGPLEQREICLDSCSLFPLCSNKAGAGYLQPPCIFLPAGTPVCSASVWVSLVT